VHPNRGHIYPGMTDKLAYGLTLLYFLYLTSDTSCKMMVKFQCILHLIQMFHYFGVVSILTLKKKAHVVQVSFHMHMFLNTSNFRVQALH